jgi:hypothetical protein
MDVDMPESSGRPRLNEDRIRGAMRETSDDELMAITTGTTPGYTSLAQSIAEQVLLERSVPLPRDLHQRRRQCARVEDEEERRRAAVEEADQQSISKIWGIRFVILGIGSFALPLVGYQFQVLIPFGYGIPVVAILLAVTGYVMVLQSNKKS